MSRMKQKIQEERTDYWREFSELRMDKLRLKLKDLALEVRKEERSYKRRGQIKRDDR